MKILVLCSFLFLTVAVSGFSFIDTISTLFGNAPRFLVDNAALTNTSLATTSANPATTPLNAITSFDSALILTHLVSPPPGFLTGNKLAAADVSSDCAISTIDAFTISDWVLNNGGGTGSTNTTIDPPGPCANSPIDTSVLMGDVSGTAPVTTLGSGSGTVYMSTVVVGGMTTVVVPIYLGGSAADVYSFDPQVSFDPAVAQPASTPVDTAGTLSSGMQVRTNVTNPGHLIISAFRDVPTGGEGMLIKLRFNIVGVTGQSSPLNFENYTDPGSRVHQGFLFNEGMPNATTVNGGLILNDPTPSNTNTPTPTQTPSISGTVTYGNAAAPPKYVSNATVTGTASGSPTVLTTTGSPGPTAGQYILTGFGSGTYTVSVSKTTGQNGITSNDAARIAQHVAGTLLLTTNNQKVTADVSNNGDVSSFDAAQIATFVATGSSPGIAGQWRFFLPPGPTFPVGSSPTTRTYPFLIQTSITGQDFVGLLVGDVTGNWTNSGARTENVGPFEKTIAVSLPNVVTPSGKEIVVPVSVNDVANKDVISYELDLRYDPTVIKPTADPVDVTSTASRGLSVVVNVAEPGLLRVVLYGPLPIDEDGLLLNLRLTAIGKPGSISPLTFERMMFNEGEPPAIAVGGQIEISTGA